jgi:3-deoxy-D-manno-octulosonic-acid transferase
MPLNYARNITKLRNCGQCNYPKKRILAINEPLVYFLYNLAISLSWYLLKIPAIFNHKLRLFIEGRKAVFGDLEKQIGPNDKLIWIHTASLGEFEQGLPVIKALKKAFAHHRILVTFFSPSGYEVKKNTQDADLIAYLPLDTEANADRFLTLVNPDLAIFVKYEIWPNYLRGLSNRNIPTLLISGRFLKKQLFFRWYGSFMRKALGHFTHFFVQDKGSLELLQDLGLQNVTISGDTRFDRVSEILKRDNTLDFMKRFKGNSLCFVLGSTWPEDEAMVLPFLRKATECLKIVIAPHDIKEAHLKKLKELLPVKPLLYSELEHKDPAEFHILLLDTIGLLTKVYSYADIAYVGGGLATGLHNTLEPAVFGIPVIIGPEYKGFKEAEDLVRLGGLSVVDSPDSFSKIAEYFTKNKKSREEKGSQNLSYINSQKGATQKILDYITSALKI